MPDGDEFSEMICSSCVSQHEFLKYYPDIGSRKKSGIQNKSESKDESEETKVKEEIKEPSDAKTETATNVDSEAVDSGHESNDSTPSSSIAKAGGSKQNCPLASGTRYHEKGPLFMDDGWRNSLCRCNNCNSLYYTLRCEHLLDEKDDVHYYEQLGKEKNINADTHDRGMAEMKNMNRVQQIELIHGYNFLKDNLAEFLKKYQTSGKVVREEDIKEFFEDLKRKKQKVQPSVVPHFCR